jgi:hypothetical protein
MMASSLVLSLSNDGPGTIYGPIVSDWPKDLLTSAGRVISAFFGGTNNRVALEAAEVVGTFSDWTTAGSLELAAITSLARETVSDAANIPTTAQAVQYLHDTSGLTWEQVSQLLGVSRRAVHMWAAGGAMSSGHEVILRRITAIIEQLQAASPSECRAAILAPRQSGQSIYDRLRSERARGDRITGAPFSFEQLIGEPDETA